MKTHFYLILFSSSLLISLIVTGKSIRWAHSWGILDEPGERKVHTTTKPRIGGLGIAAGFFLTVIAAVLLAAYLPLELVPSFFRETIASNRSGIRSQALSFIGLMGGGLIVFAGGFLDDCKNLSPKMKLTWETVGVLFLIGTGFRLDFHKVIWNDPMGEYLLSIPVTALWILFLINAFNLLDNMDGLSAGVCAITTTFFGIYAHWMGEYFLAGAMACLVGALLGFLRYNWHPSKIFMGDGGALLIGFLVAAFTCKCTYFKSTPDSVLDWFFPSRGATAEQGLLTLLTPLVIMAVPIFDTTSVILIRLKNRKPIMVGDTNHFSHRLVALGMSQKSAVEVIYLVTIFTGLGALILRTASVTQATLIFLQVLSVFGMILVLERGRKKTLAEENKTSGDA
ncbi:MAG: undecaprenyl/decaprenyl-phosphate alpha-N-acetylglucosaminyl 1-phosphate transferase [Candidatus Omnitrophica bacterium]|nr:undecaprenyl/decaprenyl-phosphate alpha-N-acetylglucosaminyl 1-phosphate transferase [Candidatus Omnitrophota bacterium]MCA9415245.1 undecaprenyl/decaprenyl-phosphate alpha-N-acetylglucosaminyl 1-phosphate transferase [Candidatus Omnitrophota bacterium]MCA9442800.1 undecaprenyl/decaprenyl-phosphate alpha-N-acetylglucosaminyl 1-phosphate transferase [Candidatus Omnitrophota bacterium]MCB9767005.1 undecaprenyl/decaprenyl-phosphate alpha-N-acetylglucosaminyl 1-phosphate transferase [Candidatus O